MSSFTIAVHSLGNIGRYAVEAAEAASDCRCLGVIRRKTSLQASVHELRGLPAYESIDQLIAEQGKPDAILLCGPSRHIPDTAKEMLEKGISTVDSFDIHTEIYDLVTQLQPVAEKNGAVAITAAGWDPGTDSIQRALFEAMVPVGTTFTNFGRGRSMGHSVAARAIPGVADAVSITIPLGGGRHSRLVYVVVESGATIDDVRKRLKADDYFAHDPLDVVEVADTYALSQVADQAHGVFMERIGASGLTPNQRLAFDMKINNPALTAQILLSAARAATRMTPGCYTLIDIPPVKLLPGDRLSHIKRLV